MFITNKSSGCARFQALSSTRLTPKFCPYTRRYSHQALAFPPCYCHDAILSRREKCHSGGLEYRTHPIGTTAIPTDLDETDSFQFARRHLLNTD